MPVSKIKIKRADASITEDVINLKEARQKMFEAEKGYGEITKGRKDEEKDVEYFEDVEVPAAEAPATKKASRRK